MKIRKVKGREMVGMCLLGVGHQSRGEMETAYQWGVGSGLGMGTVDF